MKRVAIVTARGGSKRLPRKNIRDFHGTPIMLYAIEAARQCGLFDDVLVSTEDAEIADVASRAGACWIQRPDELADDVATTAQVMRHAVGYLTDHGAQLEHVCCLYPCTPLMRPADLQAGFNALIEGAHHYAFPVALYGPAIHRALIRWPDGEVQSVWRQFDRARTQDLDPRWYDAGQWYWGTPSAWLHETPIYANRSVGIPLERWRAIDIDTEDDWVIAEAVYAAKGRSQ